jgi:endonuclease/exonuclease/phosphatase family metal-dependent hydrolase
MSTHSICRRALATTFAAGAFLLGSLATAGAQTTVTLNAPTTQVTDVMIQGGASANQNFNTLDSLATRASTNYDYLRRALLKFDTQNTIPSGSKIQSAIMTLTVKTGGTDAARQIGVFPVITSFAQEQATWNIRRTGTSWTTSGGDFGPQAAVVTVSNVVGAKVRVDVTAMVQAAVSAGASRYTRVGLSDLGASTTASYREYYSSKAVDPSVRPVLTVVYGGTSTPVPPPSTGTLRVLQYNTHHGGYGTDGVYDMNRIVDWIIKANPDVISLNEIETFDSWSKNLDQSVLYKNLLEQRTGITWYKVFVNAHGATSGVGNVVLSKYPFIATGSHLLTGGRAAVDATISVNGRTINFTSTHMDNQYESNRITETKELLAWETTFAENRIVCGDWNAWPNTTEIADMKATYTETWSAAQALGTATGNGITHGSHQIDYIFQSKGATNLKLKSVTIYNTADANGVMPSDHQPVLAVFGIQ